MRPQTPSRRSQSHVALVRLACAVLGLACTLIAAGAAPVHAQVAPGAFTSTPTFGATGLANAVFSGGTVDQLEAAARTVSASGAWVQTSDGSFQILVVGGPPFLKDAFKANFPRGFGGLVPVTLSRGSTATAAPTVQPAQVSTTASQVGACPAGSRPTAASRSVVLVGTTRGTGTAFYIGNGEWLTAGHVVDGVTGVSLKSDIISTPAQVIGIDTGRDLAILRSDAVALDALPVIEASQSDAGLGVWVIGYPLGLAGTPTLTRGTLSRVFTTDGIENVQTDASISPGNSGGPMTDDCGQVIGLVVSKLVANSASGIGFALSGQTITTAMATARTQPPASRAAGSSPSTAGPSTPPKAASQALLGYAKQVVDLGTRIVDAVDAANTSKQYADAAPGVAAMQTEARTLQATIGAYANPATANATCMLAQTNLAQAAGTLGTLGTLAGYLSADLSTYPATAFGAAGKAAYAQYQAMARIALVEIYVCGS